MPFSPVSVPKGEVPRSRTGGGRWRTAIFILMLFSLSVAGFAQEVTLSLAEFEALRHRANPEPPKPVPPPPPPAPYAVERAVLDITASPVSARLQLQLTISLFSREWQTITLPAAGSLTGIRLGALEGRITAEKDWKLVVRGTGSRTIHIEAVLPVVADEKATRPTWTMTVPLPAAACCTGTVHWPEPEGEVIFNEAGVAPAPPGADGWQFAAQPSGTLGIILLGQTRAVQRSALPLKYTATAGTRTTVGRTRSRARAWLSLKVMQGQLDTVVLEIPGDYQLINLTGSSPVGWEAAGQTVTVTPPAPVDGRLDLTADLAGPARQELASPLVIPRGAVRPLLMSAVNAEGDGMVQLESEQGLRAPEARELALLPSEFKDTCKFPVVVASSAALPRWKVEWAENTRLLSAQIDRVLINVVAGEAGTAAWQCWAEVRSSGAEALTIQPPPGFILTGAGRDGLKTIPGVNTTGLRIPLALSSACQVVHLSGLIPLVWPAGKSTLEMPMASFSAPVSRVEYVLALPPGWSYDFGQAGEPAGPVPRLASGKIDPAALAGLAGLTGLTGAAAGQWQPDLFQVPPGYLTRSGSWNAMASAISALKIPVSPETAKRSWY